MHVNIRVTALIMGGIILNTLACALLYHPVERHMKLVPADDGVQQEPEKPPERPRTVYAVSEGYDKESAALLLSIVSLLDLIGRIGGATLSDMNFMPKHYYFVSGLAVSGVALALLPIAGTYIYLSCVCALFGLASGIYIGTTAVVLADMLGPERLASSYGISLFVNGFLQLIGPPICNVAFESIKSYKPIFLTLGMIPVCGTALWAVLPLIRRRNAKKAEQLSNPPA